MKTSKSHFKQLMNNIFTSGMYEDYDIEIMHKVIMINIMTIIALIILIPFGIVDLIKGNFTIGFFVLIVAAVLIFNQFHLRKSGNYMYTIYCGISFVAAYFFYALVTGGVNNTGYLWYFTFPLFTLFLLGPTRGSIITLLLLLPSILFFAVDNISPFFTTYTIDFKIRFMVSFLVVFGYSYLFETLRKKAQLKLSLRNAELIETVTKLKEAEEQLRKSRDELEERVKERTEEIVKANQELQAEITERKKTGEALRESEAQKKAILDASIDRIRLVDKDLKIVWGNKTTTREVNISPEDLAGKFCYKVFAGRDTSCPGCPAIKALSSGNIEHAVMHQPKSKGIKGETYWDSYAVPVKNEEGNIVHIIQVTRNITETKIAEETLRKYERIISAAQEHMSLLDRNYIYQAVNDAYLKAHSKKRDEIIGHSVYELLGQQVFNKLAKDKLDRCLAGEDIHYQSWFDFPGLRQRYMDVAYYPFFEEDRSVSGVVVASRDITEKKNLEDQLQRAQKMEAIGTLAGGVAHDLNNVLSGIVSYPELLLLEIPEDSPLRNPILTIQKSGEKAADIVQDLLTLARRGVVVTEAVNLNHIISEYLRSPEHEKLKLFYTNVMVKTDLETDLLNILGSPVHLSKTIMNLVSNATESMGEGGEIRISTENRYLDRPIRDYDNVKEGDYVILTISDTGAGISSEDMEKIFEPFYTKKVMGRSGTGLGMAVVWGTVKDHNGYIDVQSIEGKGTTFTLYFPVTRKELAKDKSLLSIEDYMGKGESILVVDDVEEQREIASQILKKLGYSVTSVASGEEAVDYLKNNTADLLVLDMIMDPGIDGLETYKRILKLHPSQKAIIASGFSETDRVKEAQRLGAGAYVKKPYLLEKVGLAVRNELDR